MATFRRSERLEEIEEMEVMSTDDGASRPFGVSEAGRPPGAAQLAGVLLHGRGVTPEAMIDLAARLHVEGVRWLAPAADGGSW